MIEALKNEPDNEQEYTRSLGGLLRSTHWLEFDSTRNLIGDSTDWNNYCWFTETEFMERYEGGWWRRDAR